jgi:hypothetical protein
MFIFLPSPDPPLLAVNPSSLVKGWQEKGNCIDNYEFIILLYLALFFFLLFFFFFGCFSLDVFLFQITIDSLALDLANKFFRN